MSLEASRQADNVWPPRAGLCTALAVSTSAGSQDMRLLGKQTVNMADAHAQPPLGAPGHYVRLYADGADVGVIFGATQASVTTTNAPALATTGVNTAGVCGRIPAGTYQDFRLEAGTDVWLGYVGSTNGTLRIWQASP